MWVPYFTVVNRTGLAVSLVAALFAGVALVFVWYVSFLMGRPSSGEIRFSSMEQPAHLSYRKDGSVSISAASEVDAYRALGYQAGRDHGWTIALLRQTASGQLGEWFGTPVLPIDKFARLLGFAASARDAATRLKSEDAAALAAYSEGVSEALSDENVSLGNEFVLFDILPEPWEPWHSLAIERMIAWLSEPPITSTANDSLSWVIRSLEDDDRRFRRWLHIHGADMSAAWSWADSTGSRFAARLVYGATALPLFAAVSIEWPETSVAGVVLLGTPFMPVISGPSGVRVTMFSSDRRFESVEIVREGGALHHRHERILDRNRDEILLTVATVGDRLLVDGVSSRVKSDSIFQAVTLSWSGLTKITDWPSWRKTVLSLGSTASSSEKPEPFSLINGDGFGLNSDGSTVLGTPEVRLSIRNRLFVSNNSVVAFAARRLGAENADLQHLVHEDLSEWARDNAPPALAMAVSERGYSSQVTEAIDYLRNWDYRYNVASIGASIFDGWMLHYRRKRGTYPEIIIPDDSLGIARMQSALSRSLIAAVDSLSERAGPDLARWRLEYLRTGKRYFPVWSYPPLEHQLPRLMRSRYEPIEIRQGGHPTTLIWQPGLNDEPANSPAHVIVRGQVGVPLSITVRPDYKIGSGFIARYIAGPPGIRTRDALLIVDEVVLTPEK